MRQRPVLMQSFSRLGRFAAHALIRAYQLTLSSLAGAHCRHLPTCSAYMDEAIARHGLWAGGMLGLARLLRCHPWGTSGFDPVPDALPPDARWWRPWSYAARSKESHARQ
ncbi:MAG TPA: membrane protein insertion efficiency factor YidD [Methylocella sp.]|nr:membrane protein insertion efficiency factor YidD [Methylocella sp.]